MLQFARDWLKTRRDQKSAEASRRRLRRLRARPMLEAMEERCVPAGGAGGTAYYWQGGDAVGHETEAMYQNPVDNTTNWDIKVNNSYFRSTTLPGINDGINFNSLPSYLTNCVFSTKVTFADLQI